MWATARQILFCLSSKLPAQTGESFGTCPFPGLTLRGSQKAGTDDAMRLYLLLACYYFSGLKLLCQVGEHCVIQTKFPGKMGEISISMTKAEKRRRAPVLALCRKMEFLPDGEEWKPEKQTIFLSE